MVRNSPALTHAICTRGSRPNWEWDKQLPASGHMSVDFERRVDHDRLRRYRLARTAKSLQNSNLRYAAAV